MVYNPTNMTSHDELVMEMATLEKMSVQERLKHARKRRAQQLKRYNQSEKEFTKRQRKNTNQMKELQNRRHVTFAKNVELLEAAARGDINEVRHLLENGVDPNMGNEDGLTALHQSCIDNNEAMMRLLVEKGADVNVTDRELWTPLHAASTCGHRHLAQFLIQRGAHLLAINSDGNMPYDICEDEATLDYIESQMAAQGITQEQIDELREIVPNEMLQGMQEIYKSGGDLECRDSVGATPLHIAVANGYEKVVQYLLSHNVDYAARDNDGWQPIHAAVCWAQTDIITMLVESGADLDARTNNDETPLSICEDDEIRSLIQQLKQEIQSNRIRSPGGLVRRSSSRNKRGSSIRRSSKREKGEMRKLDAKGEAAFMQSKTEELEYSTDSSPITNIDDVALSEETNGHIEQSGEQNTEESENGEEGRVTPMPVITEEISDPESPRNKKNGDLGGDGTQENGRTENGSFEDTLDEGPTHQKRLVSILKKRPMEEDITSRKSKKEQKEEKEKLKRELKEKEKQEKQKAKEEKAQKKKEEEQRKKEEMKRKEEEKMKKKENAKPSSPTEEDEEMEEQYSNRGETLTDLKRKRAGQHSSPAAGGDNNAELAESKSSTAPSSNEKSASKPSKGLHSKLRLRPPTRYEFNVASNQGQNGEVALDSTPNVAPSEGEMKRFSGGVQEMMGPDDHNSNCCIIS